MLDHNIYLKLAVKGFVVWLVLSLGGYVWGHYAINALTPYYAWVIEQVDGNYQANVFIREETEPKVVLAATALRAVAIVPGKNLAAGKTIESSITVLHALVPLVILLTIIIVFPLSNWNQRLLLLALTVPALLLVSLLTAPLQLLGNLEIGFMNAAAKLGFSKEQPWVLQWMLLTEGGGRWLIPVLAGVGCGGIARKFFVK